MEQLNNAEIQMNSLQDINSKQSQEIAKMINELEG